MVVPKPLMGLHRMRDLFKGRGGETDKGNGGMGLTVVEREAVEVDTVATEVVTEAMVAIMEEVEVLLRSVWWWWCR